MTAPPHMPDQDRARPSRRLIYLIAAIMVMLAILLGVGLTKTMDVRRLLCPPSNPDCGRLPPPATSTG